ncbi:uncharacterized protein [Epargyreus clarus]|uniref:uncharacterized protein n=1 Tax=Epargyreus clarus TaxID=520877 RepID=UPI003C2B9BA0
MADLQGKQQVFSLKRKKKEGEVSNKKRLTTYPVNVLNQACLKVSYEAYTDIQKRFQVTQLPQCVQQCVHFGNNAGVKQVPAATEKTFNIEMKNRAWFEATEICLMCMTPRRYLSEYMLKDIVEIMMNAHEDPGYTIEYILRQCQNTLLSHFNIHPPCKSKAIRDCYKNFLTSPMDNKNETLSNRRNYDSEKGIVSHCFSRLLYEISMNSRDHTLVDEEAIPKKINDVVRRIFWRKEKFELFEFLVRTERIERLMLVLESLINLLQNDLALFHSRSFSQKRQNRSQKPLIDYILWPNSNKSSEKVTDQCKKIIKIFAYFIHLKYPEKHIKTMTIWMNTVIQMFYMSDDKDNENYPNIDNSYCNSFTKEFFKIISCLPTTSITKILEKVQPSFMQHRIGLSLVHNLLDNNENDIMLIIISCINNSSWENYPERDNAATLKNIDLKRSIEPQNLLDLLSKICRNHLSETVAANGTSSSASINPYSKLELKEEKHKIYRDYFINVLFTTFVAYLEAYNIVKYKQTLEYLCTNIDNPATSKDISYQSYIVNNNFIEKYKSTLEKLQELKSILYQKDDDPSKYLLNLINRLFP